MSTATAAPGPERQRRAVENCLRALLAMALGLSCVSALAGDAVDGALADYRAAGAGAYSVEAGQRLWNRELAGADGTPRSCTRCHGTDLTTGGRHVRTEEPIDPLAPSVNPERLSDRREIEKWLLRNCKWTFGRACTAQEKGDLLSYLRSQ